MGSCVLYKNLSCPVAGQCSTWTLFQSSVRDTSKVSWGHGISSLLLERCKQRLDSNLVGIGT